MPSMTMKRLCILLPSLLLPQMSLAQKQAQCYYPNGKVAAGDFPCDPDSEDSAFCGGALGSVCINNKLCRGPDGNLARGSCTSQTWQSPECASFCLGKSTQHLLPVTPPDAEKAQTPAAPTSYPAPTSQKQTHHIAVIITRSVAKMGSVVSMSSLPTLRYGQPSTHKHHGSS